MADIKVVMTEPEPLQFIMTESEPIHIEIHESVLSGESLALLNLFIPPEGGKRIVNFHVKDGKPRIIYETEGE